ncbi:S8/S53 family peptidase [Halomontanus rarus]|uniref:S8/S53 family peptidase n=1 Tax=Halomontanus rarus TaxID=3034020 RepID=UPI00293BDF12|nr:S8/S53 family peptidase [Halovivax sp. KZCA124]
MPENEGQFIRVGIVDSLLSPQSDLDSLYSINRRENYIASPVADTTGHGSDVLEILGYFAPKAEFNLFRVITYTGEAKRSNLADAIADASRSGIDLLNLSVGIFHSHGENHCGGNCTVATETRLAIEAGMAVVAATGNRKRDDTKAIHCPALLDESISVGGFVSRCTADLLEQSESGQYWIESTDLEGPFCGQRGCDSTKPCAEYRFEHPWRGNVSFHNAIPDVLAPVHYPANSEEGPLLQKGTSFATPIVTGLLASLLSDLFEIGIRPGPDTIRSAVHDGGDEIDEGEIPKFDAQSTWDLLEPTDE